MKKWLTLLIIALLSAFLVACGSDDKDQNDNADEQPDSSEVENDNNEEDADADTEEDADIDADADSDDTATGGELNIDPNGKNEVQLQTVQNGVTMLITYYADGDVVTEQTADNEIPYSSLGVSGEEEAKQRLAQVEEQYTGKSGIEHKLEYLDDKVVETVHVNFNDIVFEEVQDLLGFQSEGDVSNGVSLTRSVEMLQAQGFEIVE